MSETLKTSEFQQNALLFNVKIDFLGVKSLNCTQGT